MLLGCAIAQVVSHWLLIAGARVRDQGNHVGFVVDKMEMGQVSLRLLRFPLVNIIPPLPHIHSWIIFETENGPISG
jgi:hypothetical protein